MPVPFFMPKFDMDQEKATLVSWLKSEGQWVERDETVLVIETEKVAIDVPAPASGILAGICAQAGDVVPVAQVIAYILKDGENVPAATQVKETVSQEREQSPAPESVDAPAAPATPIAVRVARDLGVDLSRVPASGARITRQDVEQYAAASTGKAAPAPAAVAATPAARRLARQAGVDLRAVLGSGPQGRVQALDVSEFSARLAAQQPGPPAGPEVAPFSLPAAQVSTIRLADIVPLAGMRRTIAERMQASFHDAPHIALTIEADVTGLEAARLRLNEFAQRKSGPKVTLTALLVRLAAWSLARNPALNASLIDGQIYFWKEINIGIATALEQGLVVPVIHQVHDKTVQQIAAELQDLTGRARLGKLTLADVQYGTFTISNLGMLGIRQFRAIINPPECAILAVGSVTRKPVVINEQDEVAVRPILSITLSADHRLVDGVQAARFLADLGQALEAPELVLY